MGKSLAPYCSTCRQPNGCQVAQAGWQTGYRHPPDFSAAFSRYFGYAPKTVGRAGA
ncbi:hypothetical protein [Janthinobacterium sp. JC611]|uniref:hypothetical protein n=1 Tax=Janthinobacterium sp. JC611 TaxID=2816201 RepID=UPI00203A6D40|nr:hypothetical protein [Janthinobacterium sp. JC611]